MASPKKKSKKTTTKKATKPTKSAKARSTKKAQTAKPAKTRKPAATPKRPAKKAAPAKRVARKTAPKVVAVAPTDAEIRERARQLWEQGGARVGHANEDWFEAERQLRAERGL